MLALVCITRQENFRKKSLINYNIGRLKLALQALVNTNNNKAANNASGPNNTKKSIRQSE